jgi:hypothetical protein
MGPPGATRSFETASIPLQAMAEPVAEPVTVPAVLVADAELKNTDPEMPTTGSARPGEEAETYSIPGAFPLDEAGEGLRPPGGDANAPPAAGASALALPIERSPSRLSSSLAPNPSDGIGAMAMLGATLAMQHMGGDEKNVLDRVAAFVNQSRIEPPKGYRAPVHQSGGSWTSSDPVIDALVKWAAVKVNEDGRVIAREGETLRLEPEGGIEAHFRAFAAGCHGQNMSLVEDNTSQSKEATIAVLQRVLVEGRAAFGDDAHFTLPSGEPYRGRGRGPNEGPQHPYDYLADIGRSSVPEGEGLQKTVHDLMREDDVMAARVGTVFLLEMATKKNLDWSTLVPLGASVGTSFAIGYGVGGQALDAAKRALFGTSDSQDMTVGGKVGSTFLEAAPALVAETLDSAIVQNFVNKIQGDDWDWSWDTWKDALKAGVVSAVTALPTTAQAYFSTGSPVADDVLNFITNQIGIFGSGWILPLGSKQNEDTTNAALMKSIEDGFMAPAPAGEDGRAFVNRLTKEAMKVSASQAIVQKSLALTNVLGLLPAVIQAVMSAEKISTEKQQAIIETLQRTIFNPVEAISMTASLGLAVHAGWKNGSVTTDEEKNRQLMALALSKPSGTDQNLSPEEIRKIQQPSMAEFLGPMGGFIQRVLVGAIRGSEALTAAVGGPQSESRQINYDAATRDVNQV